MRPVFSGVFLALLCGPALAGAPRPAVRDEAGLFSAAAVARANLLLADTRAKYHIDLCVDTLTQLPDAQQTRLRALKSTKEKARFLRDLAQDRAEAEGVNGIYLLVIADPPIATLVGYPVQRESEDVRLEDGGGFSWTKREWTLLTPFRNGLKPRRDHDLALLTLVDHFRMAVDSRMSVDPSPLQTLPALIVVGGMVSLWLVLSLLRRLTLARQRLTAPAPSLYSPAMLGSLFGTPAGFWITDRLFHLQRRRTLPPGEEPPSPLPASAAPVPEAEPEALEATIPPIEDRP